MNESPLLEIRNLTTVFPTRRGVVNAVNGVDLTLHPGEILGIVGESGCGKSTVLLSILRLIARPGRIAEGAMLLRGQNLRDLSQSQMRSVRGREIAMIFQDPQSTLNPVFPIGEQIREALRLHKIVPATGRGFGNGRRKQEKQRVLQVMNEVGIPAPDARYEAYPHQFSGGMQQRALIAIGLACQPAILLADEPTTALDVTIQAQILDLMKRLNQERDMAIIMVTHDLGVAAEFCDRIAVMYAGRIVEQGRVDEMVNAPMHPYTQGLLRCRPQLGEKQQKIEPITGHVPDLSDLPIGCAFAPRCPHCQPVCEEGPIPLFDVANDRQSRCLRAVDYKRQAGWSWHEKIARPAIEMPPQSPIAGRLLDRQR